MTDYVKSISPWLPVTSSGWGSAVQEITLGLFSGLDLDFYDIHVYADWGQYSGVTALCNRVSADRVPIILGEYAQNSHTYDDTLQYWTTYNFLTTAKTHCFSAALAWKYETNELWWTYLNLKLNGIYNPTEVFAQPILSFIESFGIPQPCAVVQKSYLGEDAGLHPSLVVRVPRPAARSPRMEAADVGHDAGSPQSRLARSSCWKIDIEAPIRCTCRVAENVHIRPLDNVVHAQTLGRGPKSQLVDFDNTRGSALREGDANNSKQNASTPAMTFNQLVIRAT